MSPIKNKVAEMLPEWLDSEFFRDIFSSREELKGKVFQLRLIEGGSVVAAGENFCAQMFRVKVQCLSEDGKSQEVVSFIVKAGKSSVEFLKKQNVFGTEFDMYRTAVKSFEKLWEDIGEHVSFGPKCLKIVEGEVDILVLSDLKEQGFGMLDRHAGLDEKATLLALDRIAKFHASSVAYKEQFGDFSDMIKRKVLQGDSMDMIIRYTLPKVKTLAKATRDFKMDERIAKTVETWEDGVINEVAGLLDPEDSPEDFQVLCHGDLWLNNMMFTKDEQSWEVNDVLLIDFQMSYWNRPEGDLFYFLTSSVNNEVLISRFDYFLQFYHEKLIESMHKLNVKQSGPSLKSFHMQLLKNSFLIPRTIVSVLPVILMDKSEPLSIEDLLGEPTEEKKATMDKLMFYNPIMEEKIKLLLPFFFNRGMLETNVPLKKDINGNKV